MSNGPRESHIAQNGMANICKSTVKHKLKLTQNKTELRDHNGFSCKMLIPKIKRT